MAILAVLTTTEESPTTAVKLRQKELFAGEPPGLDTGRIGEDRP